MRRMLAALGALLTACTVVATTLPVAALTPVRANTPTLPQCQSIVKANVKVKGHFTVATNDPALAPWYVNDEPSNGQGYESALAYVFAHDFGFTKSAVRWISYPFAQSYAAGIKTFDIDLNEVTPTPARSTNVTFSSSYYDLNQSLVAMRSNAIVSHHAPSDLVKYVYGALANSASWNYIVNKIKPTKTPKSFKSLNDAASALKNGTINAMVIDTPTGPYFINYFLASSSSTTAVQFAQFPAVGDLFYAAVMQKNSPLAVCVNVAIAHEKYIGTFKTLRTTWLKSYLAIPVIQP